MKVQFLGNGLNAMGKWVKIWWLVGVAALIMGCQGGKKELPVSEKTADSFQVFVFAESPLMTIDSDKMADKLRLNQIPGMTPVIDSVVALTSVYQVLADTCLALEFDTFNLAIEDPNLYKQYLDLRQDRIMRLMYQEIIVDPVKVSDSAVLAGYETQKESFKQPDRYRARHIVISGDSFRHGTDSALYATLTDQQLDSMAHATLSQIRDRVTKGENFDTLAMLYSQDVNTAAMGGDLGYFELDQMVAPFDSTVKNTPVGKLSGIIKTEYGWHIIRVEDFSPEHYIPLDSVYQEVELKLKEQTLMEKSRAYMDSLKQAAVIVYDTAALMIVDSLHHDDDPLAYVDPDDTVYGNDTLYFREYNQNVLGFKRYKGIEGELPLSDKTELLSSVAVRYLLAQAARELGYLDDPRVVEWSREKIKQYSTSVMRTRLLGDGYEPSDEEMRAYFDAHIDDYAVERPLTVQHIVFADSSVAELVRDQLMSGVDFIEMVDKYYPGDPDIRRAAADLGEIGPNDMPGEFWRVGLATPVGAISHPVKTEYGYHLIKVLSRKYSLDFGQAAAKIKPILMRDHQRQILRAFVDARLSEAPKIRWEYLDKLYFARPGGPTLPPLPTRTDP